MKKFLSKIAHSGFYIILFLCISAIGISAYVMYLARDTAETVKDNINIESSLELPFPTEEKTLYDFGDKVDIPIEEEKQEETKNEPASVPEVKTEAKVETETAKNEAAQPTVNVTEEKEDVVYTMAVSGAITAPFSGEELVKSKTMGDWRIHSGVDIKGDIGTDVRVISDGTVSSVETDTMMGNTIKVEHADGMISIYANLDDGITVKAGDKVKSGDVIAKIGQSALAECLEEPHLHIEVLKDGKNIDPLSLFPAGED